MLIPPDPWLAMVEFAVEGSLYQYLQHRRPGDLRVEIHTDDRDSVSLKSQNLTAHKLLALAAQVVNGLQHINKFKVSVWLLIEFVVTVTLLHYFEISLLTRMCPTIVGETCDSVEFLFLY